MGIEGSRMKLIAEYLDEALRELYEERAAIMQFDGGLPKEKAESLARAEMETFRKAIEAKKVEA